MQPDPNDYDVVELLTKLKTAEAQYPTDLLASRRQGYVRRVAEIGVGLGVAMGLKTTVKAGTGGTATTTIGGIVETVLVFAIVAEASAAAYFYSDQIAEIVQSYLSNTLVQEDVRPPADASPLPELKMEAPGITETPAPTLTGVLTFTPTIVPTVVVENNVSNDQSNSTPEPNGDNGNHYGQTPQPERTKDNGNNNDGGNDKPKDKDK